MPKEVIRHELDEAQCACPDCGSQRHEIGVETSYQLEYIPAKLKAIQHDRVKYACRQCEANLAIADKPPQPIEKGLPAPGLCAHTVLSKFGDHTPLYRQEDIHARLGFTIRRSTLCGWQAQLAQLTLAFVMRMKFLVLESNVIHTDDTSIKMLEPGSGQTRTCKFWPYLGDWLHPYTEAGYLSMENNAAERLVKMPAIGRKNYLFVGSANGGRGAAIMYSLVSSAKANGVEAFAWLKELFTRLPYHRDGEAFGQAAAEEPVTSAELDYLLPDRWLAVHPEHAWEIDNIRRAERPRPGH